MAGPTERDFWFVSSCGAPVLDPSVSSQSADVVNLDVYSGTTLLALVVCFFKAFYPALYASACGPFLNDDRFYIIRWLSSSYFINVCCLWWEHPQVDGRSLDPFSEGLPGTALLGDGVPAPSQNGRDGGGVFPSQGMTDEPEGLSQDCTERPLRGARVPVVVHPPSEDCIYFVE